MTDSISKTTFEWTPAYAVGVRQIDEEHQKLFSLAETMHRAMLEGKGKSALQSLLADLVAYTCYHFTHEEQLMDRVGYPDYQSHRQEHEEAKSTIHAMQARAAAGEVTMTIEVMQFLMDWVKRHVIASDCRIGRYMKASLHP